MEMKDAPLVQEEIASAPLSSKIQSLRKVAVTVAVVALTVCGVAIGMVAAGMEKKSVPTLKYTPGTTHTYKQTGGMNFRGANEIQGEAQISVSVLSVDPVTGDATLLIDVPMNLSTTGESIVAEGDEAGEEDVMPRHLFTIVQAKNGQFYKDTLMGSTNNDNVIPVLEDFLDLMAPRLAADATVSEVDRVTESEVDAKYSVNALSNGETEVTRQFTSANMHNAKQQHAEATVATIKNGEITSVKKAASHEYSTNQGAAVDGRYMVDAPNSVVRTNVQNVDLSKYAAELEKMVPIGMISDVSVAAASGRQVWDEDFTSVVEVKGTEDEAFGSEEGDRKLLAALTFSYNVASWDRWDLRFSGGVTSASYETTTRCENAGNTCYKTRTIELKLTVVALDVANHDVGPWIKWTKATESSSTSSASSLNSPKVAKHFGVTIWKEGSSTIKSNFNLKSWSAWKCTGNCENSAKKTGSPWEKMFWSPSLPVPYLTIADFGLFIKFGAGVGLTFKPKCQLNIGSNSNSKGPNYSGCSKSKNAATLYLCYQAAPYTALAYVVYTAAKHAWNAFTNRDLKASCQASLEGTLKVAADAGLSTGCWFRVKYKMGLVITGYIIKIKIEISTTISFNPCGSISKGVSTFAIGITAYVKRYYGYKCRKHKPKLTSVTSGLTWGHTYGSQFIVLKYIAKCRAFQHIPGSTQAQKASSFYTNSMYRAYDAGNSNCRHWRHVAFNDYWMAKRHHGRYLAM